MLHRTEHLYDAANRITQQPSVLGSRIYTSTYTYNDNIASNTGPVKDGSLKQVEFSAPDKTLSFTYDSLKHLSSAAVNGLYTRTYSYRAIDGQRSSNQISGLSYAANNSGLTALSYTYTYDNRGNITQIKQNGSTVAEYTYNGQNQLISEKRGSTYTYTYDTAGNILKKTVSGTTKTYTYGDTVWQDLLTAYNGHAIYYEGQNNDPTNYPISGNPTNWYNGSTYTNLTWSKGRQLSSLTKGSTSISYTYDMDGIRKAKTVGTEQHTYLTQNGQVVRETIGTGSTAKILDFVYDNNGQPFALCYSTNNGQTFTDYFYVTNLQGDVVRLVDSNGNTEASYEYDAWGKLLSVTDFSGISVPASNTNHIANLNPLRYRGYYYDKETGWYYLQSRYYDPEVGRFINADLPEYSAAFSLDDNNLFTYCGNNPILRDDKDGEFWNIVIGAAVGAAVGVVVSVVSQGIEKGFKNIDVKRVILSGVSGAISGGFAATGIKVNGQMVANGIIGGVTAGFDTYLESKGTASFSDYAINIGTGVAIGIISGRLGGDGTGSKHLTSSRHNLWKHTKGACKNLFKKGLRATGKELLRSVKYWNGQTFRESINCGIKAIRPFLRAAIPSAIHSVGGALAK